MTKRVKLILATEGVCAGHLCDECDSCAAGVCCGAEVGEGGYPAEGMWPYEHHAPVGVIYERDNTQLCHCCGGWFELLGRHAKSHGLTADTYRAIWGLRCTQPLAGSALRAVRADIGREHGHRLTPEEQGVRHMTGEQRSKVARKREARAQVRKSKAAIPRDESGQWVHVPGRIMARRRPLE